MSATAREKKMVELLVAAHTRAREEASDLRSRVDAAQLVLAKNEARTVKALREAIWNALAGNP